MTEVEITPADESHFKAHEAELEISRDEVFDTIRKELDTLRSGREPGDRYFSGSEVRSFVRCSRPVGLSGLKRIRPWTRDHFWDYRPGRSIPSHLCRGRRIRTRDLCFWGRWDSNERFVLHTFYPGRPAPREIHDPEITLEELPASIRFWTRHAIIVAA